MTKLYCIHSKTYTKDYRLHIICRRNLKYFCLGMLYTCLSPSNACPKWSIIASLVARGKNGTHLCHFKIREQQIGIPSKLWAFVSLNYVKIFYYSSLFIIGWSLVAGLAIFILQKKVERMFWSVPRFEHIWLIFAFLRIENLNS